MLRDIARDDPQVSAIAQIVAHIAPDILFLQGIDFDHNLTGAQALRDALAKAGTRYKHVFALPPNAGLRSGLDLNGDGRLNGFADNQGYGRFYGDGAMVLLSRWPVHHAGVQDFSGLLWRDLDGAQLPIENGAPFPSKQAQAAQRLSSVGHWIVPVTLPDGRRLNLMMFAAGPPVFDGPEDRNGLRNADEIRLWQVVLDGGLGMPPAPPFVVLGNANLDPTRGEGRRAAIVNFLSDPRLQDPHARMGPTVDWSDPTPGDLRVDYVLPSAD
ncbi:endonuclease/exonuclease/phosphatase family protein, partial [Roseobacter sp.]|uniref:endonuclease/exonuclease/phosphatase family protein n=1 Tax=Roseobacter sp. TaxID=1907202 RepID=UPI003296CCAF